MSLKKSLTKLFLYAQFLLRENIWDFVAASISNFINWLRCPGIMNSFGQFEGVILPVRGISPQIQLAMCPLTETGGKCSKLTLLVQFTPSFFSLLVLKIHFAMFLFHPIPMKIDVIYLHWAVTSSKIASHSSARAKLFSFSLGCKHNPSR